MIQSLIQRETRKPFYSFFWSAIYTGTTFYIISVVCDNQCIICSIHIAIYLNSTLNNAVFVLYFTLNHISHFSFSCFISIWGFPNTLSLVEHKTFILNLHFNLETIISDTFQLSYFWDTFWELDYSNMASNGLSHQAKCQGVIVASGCLDCQKLLQKVLNLKGGFTHCIKSRKINWFWTHCWSHSLRWLTQMPQFLRMA